MESEDGTFELLSISALSAWQIIFGKMTSAVVQIVLYLSALAPCIVLTYLMRGVSLFSILFALAIAVAFSVPRQPSRCCWPPLRDHVSCKVQ